MHLIGSRVDVAEPRVVKVCHGRFLYPASFRDRPLSESSKSSRVQELYRGSCTEVLTADSPPVRPVRKIDSEEQWGRACAQVRKRNARYLSVGSAAEKRGEGSLH